MDTPATLGPDGAALTTKETVGEYDAIESAKPGEILFPVQGGDPFGPKTVLFWADLCRKAGIAEEHPEKAAHLLRKASNAETVAWAMMAYQRNEGTASDRRSQLSDDTLAAHAGAVLTTRASLIQAARTLHNALAQCVEVADSLDALKEHPSESVVLRSLAAAISHISETVEPRRGNERS